MDWWVQFTLTNQRPRIMTKLNSELKWSIDAGLWICLSVFFSINPFLANTFITPNQPIHLVEFRFCLHLIVSRSSQSPKENIYYYLVVFIRITSLTLMFCLPAIANREHISFINSVAWKVSRNDANKGPQLFVCCCPNTESYISTIYIWSDGHKKKTSKEKKSYCPPLAGPEARTMPLSGNGQRQSNHIFTLMKFKNV